MKFAREAAEPGYAARGPGERPVGVEAIGPAGPGSESGTTGGKLAKEGGSAETPLGPGGRPVHPGADAPSLVELLRMALSEEGWEAFSRGSAIRRAGRAGFARNVCVAIGNWSRNEAQPDPHAVDLLIRALSDPEPLVCGHAACALGQTGSAKAQAALEFLLESEDDPWVREELELALGD